MTRHGSGPRVTVVIPTYNWATVLPFAIRSVLDQTYEDFELLVVGDGCTDESATVVASIEDARVRWINLTQNTGHQTGPNNEGQRQAAGEMIAYLGHDDLWLPNHLALLVAALHDGAPCAHSSVLVVGPHGQLEVTPREGWTYSRGDWLPPTSFAVSRAMLERVGGWRPPRRTGSLDPEADLLARLCDVAGPPVRVQHLTCVKLPAAWRKDVYRTRPNDEQQYWLDKIRRADDPEADLLATVGRPYELATTPPAPPDISFPVRAWRSLRYRVRRRLGITVRAEDRIRRARARKGL